VRKNAGAPVIAGLVMALSAAPAVAQGQQTKDGPDAATVHALVQQALQQVQPAPVPQPGQAATPFVTPGPRVDLSIEDAVQRAREKNIDISVARITPRLTDFTIAGLEANYHLNLTAATNTQRSSRFPTQTIQGISQVSPTYSEGWSSGFAKNMWWGGGSWQVNSTTPGRTPLRTSRCATRRSTAG
jgi:hypothetical protein